MKTVVVLRHAERQDRSIPQSHLSQAGIEQARVMSARFDRFDFVVASTSPRAFETAIAMGFAVDIAHPSIEQHSEQIMRDVAEIGGFSAWAAAYRSKSSVIAYTDHVTSLLKIWLEKVPEGGSLLVVTHGGIVEALATGLLPDSDLTELGGWADYAEGFMAVEFGEGFELTPLRR